LTIQVDSREKARAIKKILATFDSNEVKYYISKLWTGDYMSLDNPRLIIDRKQNLIEVCNNVIQDHKRFVNELTRAQENGIKLVFLCEHGNGIENLPDVMFWDNPRCKKRVRGKDGKWVTEEVVYRKEITTKSGQKSVREYHPTTGPELYKKLSTMTEKYGCEFLFCEKKDTGKRIIEILGEKYDDRREKTT
jgi:hypothetical protein